MVKLQNDVTNWFQVSDSAPHVTLLIADGYESHDLGPMVKKARQIVDWIQTDCQQIHMSPDGQFFKITFTLADEAVAEKEQCEKDSIIVLTALAEGGHKVSMTGYSRPWICDYALKTAPLRAMIRAAGQGSQSARLQWTDEADGAFHLLKKDLQTAPALANPDYSRPMPLPQIRGPVEGPAFEQLERELGDYLRALTQIHRLVFQQVKEAHSKDETHIPVDVRDVQVGDLVFIRVFRRQWNEPHPPTLLDTFQARRSLSMLTGRRIVTLWPLVQHIPPQAPPPPLPHPLQAPIPVPHMGNAGPPGLQPDGFASHSPLIRSMLLLPLPALGLLNHRFQTARPRLAKIFTYILLIARLNNGGTTPEDN
ncbi:hypothetical protein D4764_09G0010230 [Takifugu flavidus]|uniref:Uncharacterized protein n=1 Tax=Takifugu flavidus TaxID=433684 RepID=A0A5C6MM85_9TELE|nr:hypothetical protein D4764_09G0010230 [Takifugu flavidus]